MTTAKPELPHIAKVQMESSRRRGWGGGISNVTVCYK